MSYFSSDKILSKVANLILKLVTFLIHKQKTVEVNAASAVGRDGRTKEAEMGLTMSSVVEMINHAVLPSFQLHIYNFKCTSVF